MWWVSYPHVQIRPLFEKFLIPKIDVKMRVELQRILPLILWRHNGQRLRKFPQLNSPSCREQFITDLKQRLIDGPIATNIPWITKTEQSKKVSSLDWDSESWELFLNSRPTKKWNLTRCDYRNKAIVTWWG